MTSSLCDLQRPDAGDVGELATVEAGDELALAGVLRRDGDALGHLLTRRDALAAAVAKINMSKWQLCSARQLRHNIKF